MSPKKDDRYFISTTQYNCPFCETAAVHYKVIDVEFFNWSETKDARCLFVQCQQPACGKISLHMTHADIAMYETSGRMSLDNVCYKTKIKNSETGEEEEAKKPWPEDKIDALFFYHHPNSDFIIDERIPPGIREALDEANTSHKMNLHTGASACLRKAIFELLAKFKVPKIKKDDEDKDKFIPYLDRLDILKDILQEEIPTVETTLVDEIKKVYSITSHSLHERLPDEEVIVFEPKKFLFLMGVVHNLLTQVFIAPDERKERNENLAQLAKSAGVK